MPPTRTSTRTRSDSTGAAIDTATESTDDIIQRRTSSRSNKFLASMKEKSESIRDLLGGQSERLTSAEVEAASSSSSSPGKGSRRSRKSRSSTKRKKRKRSKKVIVEIDSESNSSTDAGEDEDEDEDEDEEEEGSSTPSPRKKQRSSKRRSAKSPAIRHSTRRRRVQETDGNLTSEEESDEESESDYEDMEEVIEEEQDSDEYDEDEEEEEEEEELKIQRIIACQSQTLAEWKERCHNMNTSEVDRGSRWEQDDKDEGMDKVEERFLIKWTGFSYLHCSWETQKDMMDEVENVKAHFSTFFRKSENGYLFDADERMDGEFFDPSFMQIDRILEVHNPDGMKIAEGERTNWGIIPDPDNPDYENGTGRQFLVKWENTSYSDLSYEFERDLIMRDVEYLDKLKEYVQRSKKPTKTIMKKVFTAQEEDRRRSYKIFGDRIQEGEEKDANIQKYKKGLEDFVFKNGGQVRDYQAEGVSWMIANHVNKRSCILADEMGLGKTIQTAVFINTLATSNHMRGPFLIVAPLSTIPHWYREFTGWTKLNTIIYHGTAEDRARIRQFEFAYEQDRPKGGVGFNQRYLKKCHSSSSSKWQRTWMAEVVITTPEMLVTDDFSELAAINWEILVVDEAHRLKNHSSKLALNLRRDDFQFNHTLLLTGTPIQNNMNELWTLMNIVDAEKFEDLAAFMEQYGNMKSKEHVDELHGTIRPYILRRLKEDVEKSVPPKEETLIEVELTIMQKKYYRALYEKNVQYLHRNVKKALHGPSLNNLAMQLRKCCNHPFLLTGVEDEAKQEAGTDSSSAELDLLVKSSGKLVLLDKLLPHLKKDGHRILIFSQFKIMLDILEDYLDLRNFRHERIDGSITGKKRQMAIDRFQAKESLDTSFIMLLSTRAGGVGINLTAADTCIIFDSDWNPQNDLQAQARCHRIGQTKSVKIYRLLSRKTYEMQMFHMSSMKMGLDQAVLQGIEGGGSEGENIMTKEEVEKLLRHGAYDMFSEEKNDSSEKESNAFVEQDLESILARRSKTVVHDNTGTNSSAAGGAFSKASFKASSPDPNSDQKLSDKVDIDDPDFWTKMVGESKIQDNNMPSGRKRARKNQSYDERIYDDNLNKALLLPGATSSLSLSGRFLKDADDESFNADMMSTSSSDDSTEDIETEQHGSEFDLTRNLQFQSKDLQNIYHIRLNSERRGWGGLAKNHWKKQDFQLLLELLTRYGLPTSDSRDFLNEFFLKSSKAYDETEVKRMSWALCLVIFKEAVKQDVQHTIKLATRQAEHEQDTKEDKAKGGDGSKKNASASELADLKKTQYKSSFQKLWVHHSSWLTKVLEEGINYAKLNFPRGYSSNGAEATSKTSPMLIRMFVENMWPSLRTRGWKIVSSYDSKRNRNRRFYKHDGDKYSSMAEVLDAIPQHHPELASVTADITSKSLNSEAKAKDEKQKKPLPSLGEMDYSKLSDFLDQYAPLQLIFDRKSSGKMLLQGKMLEVLSYLQNAHFLVNKTKEESDDKFTPCDYKRLAEFLSVNKRASLPHPLWSPSHDAVLIYAIAKHGWIDRESHCRSIIEDKEIKWGIPFEEIEANNLEHQPSTEKTNEGGKTDLVDISEIKTVATRVVTFLNKMHDKIVDSKVFNWDLVLKSYGIVRNVSDNDDDTERWTFDEKFLISLTQHPNDKKSDKKSKSVAELPTRNALLKRAKTILSRSSLLLKAPETPNESTDIDAVKPSHSFSVLDQGNRCNIFLAEILRLYIKTSRGKGADLKKLGNAAKIEAEARFQATKEKDDVEAKALENIIGHIKFVTQYTNQKTMGSLQAKNIFRVILGIEPLQPRKEGGTLFLTKQKPLFSEKHQAEEIQRNIATRKKLMQKESASGDAAINRALNTAKRRNKSLDGSESSSCLRLTFMEALILSVLCSQGIPIYFDELSNLFSSIDNVSNEFALTWMGLGAILEVAAKEWHASSEAKLAAAREAGNDQNTIAELEEDTKVKREVFIESLRLHQSPDRLAKKSIMLLEAIRLRIGQVDAPKRKGQGLGARSLQWNGKHLCNWAKSLGILHNGRPLANTGEEFMSYQGSEMRPAAFLEKKECKAIYAQLSQQTRLRSIFMKYNPQEMFTMLSKATKNSIHNGDQWDAQPRWWGVEEPHPAGHDGMLLSGMLKFGFGGFETMIEQNKTFNLRMKNDDKPLTRKSIQQRVNNMTRELSVLDDSADNIRLLEERKKKRSIPNVDPQSSPKPSNTTSVQMGINAYLQSQATKEVVALCDSETSDQNDVICTGNSSGTAKRGAEIGSIVPSPTKKVKN